MTRETGTTTRASAVRRLAERWIRELEQPGAGLVCSPAGLWLALAAVAAGARGETADELRALLGVADREAAAAVTEAAHDLAGTGALRVATRVWSTVPVRDAYQEALPDIGFGPMDPAGIDAWVREETGGLIERLPVRITDETLLALVNVLAMTARWETPFEPRRTRPVPFTDASGTSSPVPTMHGSVPLRDAWTADGVYVVELRCRTEPEGGAPARVRFVLGERGATASDVLPAAWAPGDSRVPLDTDVVSIGVPRLTLRTTVQVTEQLPALGVRISTTDAADFSGMSPRPLAISAVVQETVVKIAEEGVEAAAVTVVAMRAGSAPGPRRRVEHLAFDRPFGIVVLDGTGDIPLFTAWQAGIPEHQD